MSWRPKQAASNKQIKPNKIDRAAEFVSSTLAREQDHAGLMDLQFLLGSKPEGVLSPDYLKQAALRASQKLSELGIQGWQADLEASQAASQVPNTSGYGNEGVRVWDRDRHVLIFARVAELAEVHALQLPVVATAETGNRQAA